MVQWRINCINHLYYNITLLYKWHVNVTEHVHNDDKDVDAGVIVVKLGKNDVDVGHGNKKAVQTDARNKGAVVDASKLIF